MNNWSVRNLINFFFLQISHRYEFSNLSAKCHFVKFLVDDLILLVNFIFVLECCFRENTSLCTSQLKTLFVLTLQDLASLSKLPAIFAESILFRDVFLKLRETIFVQGIAVKLVDICLEKRRIWEGLAFFVVAGRDGSHFSTGVY